MQTLRRAKRKPNFFMFLRSGVLFAAAGGKVVGAKGLSLCGWVNVCRKRTCGGGGCGNSDKDGFTDCMLRRAWRGKKTRRHLKIFRRHLFQNRCLLVFPPRYPFSFQRDTKKHVSRFARRSRLFGKHVVSFLTRGSAGGSGVDGCSFFTVRCQPAQHRL